MDNPTVYPSLPGDVEYVFDDTPLMLITAAQLKEGYCVQGRYAPIRMAFRVVARRSDGIVVVDPRPKKDVR